MSLAAALIALSLIAAPTQTPEAIFKSAIEDFEFGEHAQAADKLRSILDPPRLTSKEDLIVARQYLGACYHLLGDKTNAKSQFTMLLLLDRKHKLDPEVFSPALVEFFEGVRREAGVDRDPEEKRDQPPPPPPLEKKEPDAVIEKPLPSVKEPPPAALALIPFGVGQFANRHPVRGTLFAVTEVGLFSTSIATFVMLGNLKLEDDRCPPVGLCVADENQSRASTLQTIYLATFWTGLGVLAAGVVEALISYPGDAVED